MKEKRTNASQKRNLKSMKTSGNTVIRPSKSIPARPSPGSKTPIRKNPIANKPNRVVPKQKLGQGRALKIGIAVGILMIILIGVGLIIWITPDKKETVEYSPQPSATVTNAVALDSKQQDGLVEAQKAFDVEFGQPQINGTSEAIIQVTLLSEKAIGDNYYIKVVDQDEYTFEQQASELGNGVYVKADKLLPETTYTCAVFKQEEQFETEEQAPTTFTFTTPKRSQSIEEIEALLERTCDRTIDAMSEENQILYESQAIMQLLGMDIDIYGRMETLTQVNQVMLDYSLNSYGEFVFWNNINESPTKDSLAILKDILSVDMDITKQDIIKEFTISPFSMTDYIKYDHHGGQISNEDYIFDRMRDSQDGSAYFQLYPYVVDTPEFQTKYENLINGNLEEDSKEMKELIAEFGEETFEEQGDALYDSIAAKNKALFSRYCDRWLEEVAKLSEKRIYLYSESGRYSMDSMLSPTMVAFAYMYVEYRELTGNDLTVNNCYRSGDVQWDKYSRGYGYEKVLEWSASWHKQRQIVSYVPGFSNHQLAASIDYQPAQYVFIHSEEYQYLEENAARYGVYNYMLEPWHWTYLGAEIDQETIESTPLATPIVEE